MQTCVIVNTQQHARSGADIRELSELPPSFVRRGCWLMKEETLIKTEAHAKILLRVTMVKPEMSMLKDDIGSAASL